MPPKSKRVLPGKRYPLNMRTTKELRGKIEEAAMASGRSLVQEVEFRLEQSFRREEDDRRRKKELEWFGVKIVEEMQKKETPYMRAVRQWEEQTGERAGLLNPKFLEFIKKLRGPRRGHRRANEEALRDPSQQSDPGNSGAQSPSARAEEGASEGAGEGDRLHVVACGHVSTESGRG